MKHSFATQLKAGLLVGTLDITAACIQHYIKTEKGPAGVMKYVASGVFGPPSFTGGDAMIFWGLLFHFIIAVSFAFFFFLIFPALQSFTKNKIITGVVYGIFTWAVTNLIIVRLSNTPKFPFNAMNAAIAATILIVCIGIPLAYIAAKPAKNIPR